MEPASLHQKHKAPTNCHDQAGEGPALLLNVNVHATDLGIGIELEQVEVAGDWPSSRLGSVPPNDILATATGELALRQTASCRVQGLPALFLQYLTGKRLQILGLKIKPRRP